MVMEGCTWKVLQGWRGRFKRVQEGGGSQQPMSRNSCEMRLVEDDPKVCILANRSMILMQNSFVLQGTPSHSSIYIGGANSRAWCSKVR